MQKIFQKWAPQKNKDGKKKLRVKNSTLKKPNFRKKI